MSAQVKGPVGLAVVALIAAVAAVVFFVLAGLNQRKALICQQNPQCFSNYYCADEGTVEKRCPAKASWQVSLYK